MSNSDPLILAIETATRSGSVAVARGEQLLSSVVGDPSTSRSADLIELVESALRSAGVQLSEMDLFAAAVGPGSFTGLRIGLATAKSFAVNEGRKCAGISTLAAIALAAGKSELTVSVLPAGRGEVFAQSFSVQDSAAIKLDEAQHLKPQALCDRFGEQRQILWAGEGAHVHAELLRERARAKGILFGNPTAGWSLAEACNELAGAIAVLAMNEYKLDKLVGPEALHAEYVRASDAEINQRWQPEKALPKTD
jgi:tRNA threonylcarbamoyladenosine biosynthesis protein TsaB